MRERQNQYPQLEVDLGKLQENLAALRERCQVSGIKLSGIVKGFCALPEAAKVYDRAGLDSIGSSRLEQLRTLRQAGIRTFGDSIMVQPRYVIVPVGYGFLMSQILETAQIDVDGIGSHTANALYQYRNRLQVIEEGTLNALAGSNAVPWFVAGDPTYARSIQVDYLNGQETPTIRRMEVAGQLGYVWDIWLDWGITAVDFRGIAKNPGTTITL